MSCCGKGRAAYTQANIGSTQPHESQYRISQPIEFEYSGQGELTVTGPLSGVVYRFTPSARRVSVHGPDAPSLLSVPGLRPVR
jgi:hypothetical protein